MGGEVLVGSPVQTVIQGRPDDCPHCGPYTSERNPLERWYLSRCRVEERRGGVGSAYLFPALSVAGASIASPCPVSSPRSSNRTGPFKASGSRTRLDHPFAHGERPAHPRRLYSPRVSYKWPFGNRVFPGPRTLYLAFSHRRSRYRTWLSTRR